MPFNRTTSSPTPTPRGPIRTLFRLFLLILIVFFAIQTVKIFTTQSSKIVIAIDPGHGGLDTGALGVENEAAMTERTADILFSLLKEDPRFKPIYTRSLAANKKYTLADRINKANRTRAQLFLSIHGNASPKKNAAGFECYATPPGRPNHDQSLRFATNIANKMGAAGHKIRGENGVRYLYYVTTSPNPDSEGGAGGSSESSGASGLGDKEVTRRDIREASYRDTSRTEESIAVVEKPNCPSVLVEQCFVDNPEDHGKWGSPQGAAQSAQIYYEAICEYFALGPKP